MIKKLLTLTLLCICGSLRAQQPYTSNTQLFFNDARYVQGVGPGYWPTTSSGFVLKLTPGSVVCHGTTPTTYIGGILTLAANTTSYVQLNSSASCAPYFNTSGFISGNSPIAIVVTNGSHITSIADWRSFGVSSGGGGGGGTPGGNLNDIQINTPLGTFGGTDDFYFNDSNTGRSLILGHNNTADPNALNNYVIGESNLTDYLGSSTTNVYLFGYDITNFPFAASGPFPGTYLGWAGNQDQQPQIIMTGNGGPTGSLILNNTMQQDGLHSLTQWELACQEPASIRAMQVMTCLTSPANFIGIAADTIGSIYFAGQSFIAIDNTAVLGDTICQSSTPGLGTDIGTGDCSVGPSVGVVIAATGVTLVGVTASSSLPLIAINTGLVSGGGSGVAIKVNGGSALTSPVNFQNGTSGNAINFSNPSGSNIQATIASGAVTSSMLASGLTLGGTTTGTFSGNLTGAVTGNASTSSAFNHSPTNCSGSQFSVGINADGSSNCGTPGGGGSAPTLSTNGVNNASQTILNFITSTTNTDGLTITPVYSATGNERMELTGTVNAAQVNGAAVPASKTIVGTNSSSQIVDASAATLANNTTGNAATATALASIPSGCGTNLFAYGVAANGNLTCKAALTANAGTAHQFFSSVTAPGVFTTTQPAFSDLSGSATNSQLPGTGSMTVNTQTCTLAGSCNIPFSTNGTGNTSLNGINLINSISDSVGLHITISNPGTNQVRAEISGSTYSGKSATTTALASAPSVCGVVVGQQQFPVGINVSGNPTSCATPGSGIPNIQITVATGTYNANSCSASPLTAAMTGVYVGPPGATFSFAPTSDISGSASGFSPTGPTLWFLPWASANTLNYKICNNSSSNIVVTSASTWNVSAK